jgi:hypothetical protein
MLIPFTDHARARMQQRGIRFEALEELFERGRVCHLHSEGRELVHFRKIYAVLGSDGTVITVGHRYRRVRAA